MRCMTRTNCFILYTDFKQCQCWFMVFNATFNCISVISWWSGLSLKETGGPGENHRPVTSHWQTLLHNVVSSTPRLSWVRTHNVSGDMYWLHSCISNYHTLTTTTALSEYWKYSYIILKQTSILKFLSICSFRYEWLELKWLMGKFLRHLFAHLWR
jgi:hypothetical protein